MFVSQSLSFPRFIVFSFLLSLWDSVCKTVKMRFPFELPYIIVAFVKGCHFHSFF
jgi:hypothetical protein